MAALPCCTELHAHPCMHANVRNHWHSHARSPLMCTLTVHPSLCRMMGGSFSVASPHTRRARRASWAFGVGAMPMPPLEELRKGGQHGAGADWLEGPPVMPRKGSLQRQSTFQDSKPAVHGGRQGEEHGAGADSTGFGSKLKRMITKSIKVCVAQ